MSKNNRLATAKPGLARSKSKSKITIASIFSFITGAFGIIGVSGWCCTIAGAAFLSFLGLASISTFLVYNNKWLFVLSFIFLFLAIFYYIKYKKNTNCPADKNQ